MTQLLFSQTHSGALRLHVGQGGMHHYETMIEAANAFTKADEPYKAIVYDDGCQARDLNGDEQRLLVNVCAKLGYDVEEIGAWCRSEALP